MLRFGVKATTDFARRSSKITAKGLRSCRFTVPGSARPSFRCFSASSIVSDSKVGTVVPPVAVPIDINETITDAVVQLSAADLSYYPSHLVMSAVENIHLFTGMPYWQTIILTTVGLRLALIPLSVSSIQNTNRMSILRPAMAKLKEQQERHPNPTDPIVKERFDNQTRQMMIDHKVNPVRSLAMPFIQLPIFLSLYFALTSMGSYFPGYASGGDYWFTDLTAADSTYIFPALNALSFLIMIEIGSDGFNTENKDMFKWGMRGLAVAIGPMTYLTPQGVFMYWTANNVMSIIQTVALKQEKLRNYFDIPAMPKAEEVPALKMVNPFRRVVEVIKREATTNASGEVEIVDKKTIIEPVGPPPLTFAGPPNKKKLTKLQNKKMK